MSDEYRRWIAGLPCCVSGYVGEGIDPHHIKGSAWLTGGGLAKKISEVYEILNRHTSQKLGVSVDWPHDEPPVIYDK